MHFLSAIVSLVRGKGYTPLQSMWQQMTSSTEKGMVPWTPPAPASSDVSVQVSVQRHVKEQLSDFVHKDRVAHETGQSI